MIGICKLFFAKIRAFCQRIPLQVRVVSNFIVMLLILALPGYIIAVELPYLHNMEARVSLETERRLIGPSEFLGSVDFFVPEHFSYPNGKVLYDRLVIAQTQEGVIMCGYSTKNDAVKDFNYIKKQDECTMTAAQQIFLHNDKQYRGYVLFADQQDAVRADVMIELKEMNGEEPVYTLSMASYRENPGYFFFMEKNDSMANSIVDLLRGDYYATTKYYCTVLIQLYNADDLMICQKEMNVYRGTVE